MKKIKIKTTNGSDFTVIEGPNKRTFVSKDGTKFNEETARKLLKKFSKELIEVKEDKKEEVKKDSETEKTPSYIVEDSVEEKKEDESVFELKEDSFFDDEKTEEKKEDEILVEVPKRKSNRKSKKKSKKNK